MDSFGFDFAGSDLLDLGSLGSWTNSTPMGSSPNGGSGGGGLPFSVGTPTGVQSLGDDPFASMPSGGDHDFSFGDSPKPSPSSQSHKHIDNAAPNSSGSNSASSTSAQTSSGAGDMATNYFGAELEVVGAPSSAATTGATSTSVTTDVPSTADDKSKMSGKNETDAQTKIDASSAPTSTSASATASSATSNAVNASPAPAPTNENASSSTASSSSTTSKSSPSSATSTAPHPTPSSGVVSSVPISASGAVSSSATAPSTTSSARPHIGSQQHQQQQQQIQMQQQRQQQYANQMVISQQNGQPQQFAGQSYQQQMHAGQIPGGVSGGPPTSAAGTFMGGQPGQTYRPPTSSYEEEFARVKAMMMQHPDLIPPPMEVLRISMSQSAAGQQNIAMGGNAYIQRGNPAMARGGVPANTAYGQYGNPNMMMGGPQPNASQAGMVNAARMRAAQMAQQQAQQRAVAGRTPGGSNDPQTAWQSENDLPLRRKMIGKIVSLLQQRKPDAPAEWIRRLPDMARRLEDSLYRTAKNRDEYGDFSSLKTRLQHLAVTMGARAQHKAGGNPRAAGASAVPGSTGGVAGNNAMMAANAPPGIAMNSGAGTMGPQGHVVGNMPYGNRMTQQQLLQQQHMQMQMQQNPQIRQQLTPQQLQQFQEAQLQRRQLQMQQAQQQAQMQRQNSLQQQQYQQNQALQRQNSMRQMQQQQMQQHMQQRQNPNYIQQQQQQQHQAQAHARAQAQAQAQRNGSANGVSNQQRMSVDMSVGESSDFLNLDLSSSLLGSDDLQGDGSSGLSSGDTMKSGNNDTAHLTGQKRTLSQSQQQMAAAANAAAFKRTKVGAAGQSSGQPGGVPNQQHSAATNSGPQVSQSSQNQIQKPVTSTSGSSKTPPMSTVNAK